MTVDSGVLFDQGLDFFDDVASKLDDSDWEKPSPCDGWTALDVFGHLTTSLGMGLSLVRGEQPTWPEFEKPSDLIDGEPLATYRPLVEQLRAELDGADLDLEMDTPMGTRTVRDRLAFPAIDLYVHAWDIGTAAGIPVEIPQDVIDFSHGYIDPLPQEMVRGPKGAFSAEAEVPADATPTEEFVAWTGRSPR